ncbi:MAG TPA: glycosyltransferase family 4 protein [Thermoanaerobaculia bacterium]|nr:glycosyltransferase family 4 protein [Thermoanaerobaculia bacterium]
MKILHLAAGNRWTGAAAPAFAEVEALRAAAVEAHYAYVGGYKLEAKIGHLDYTHAVIGKAQNPASFLRSVRAIRRLVEQHGFDVVHAHLTYDHWLARIAVRGTKARVARTFHARRVLRGDPFTRMLVSRTAHLFAVNEAFLGVYPGMVFTPPPLEHGQFSPDGPNVRGLYGIHSRTKLVTVIGKLSKRRGFEEALSTFAFLRARMDGVRMMVIGHGEHRPALEALAADLGITADLIWAGYHEDDLAEHYRASDLLLFTERGSDEGHRAVLEAMACGVPVAAYPVEGVAALIGAEAVAPARDPEALTALAASLLTHDREQARREVVARSQEFGYGRAAERLTAAYER